MKIRNGFVSNSSSSSFVIASKKPLSEELFMQVLGVPENSPLSTFAKEISKWFVENAKKLTIKEYLDKYDYGGDDIPEIVKKAIKKDLTIYAGYAANDDGHLEEAICNMDFDYESDDFIIEKDGGY